MSTATLIGKLPEPGIKPVSTVVYTRTENQVQMKGTDVTVLIDGSDIVLKSADGKMLILPLAAELASYESNLFKLVFADGVEMTSDDLLRIGKVVNVNKLHSPQAEPTTHETTQGKEVVVEKIVEKVVVLEQESSEPVEDRNDQLTAAKIDALSLTKATTFTSDSDSIPVIMRSSSSATRKPEPSVTPQQPEPPKDPMVPTPVQGSAVLHQLDAMIDPYARVYRGGTGTNGAQTDASLPMQYGSKKIDLSEQTSGWTVYVDDPNRLSADRMMRVITISDAVDVVSISAGLPTGYTAVKYGTPEGDHYGLQPGQVLLIYPTGRHDSLALTFQYTTSHGGPTLETTEMFVVEDDPYAIQREDGAYLLASNHGTSQVMTGSGDDVVHVGFTSTEIHTGAGNDTIIASTAKGSYDGGGGNDTVDYSRVNKALIVDLSKGTTSIEGSIVHTLTSIETIIGSDYADTLIAGSGNATLQGGAGDDLFIGGSGNSTFDGGTGVNRVDYSQSDDTRGVVVSLERGSSDAGRNGYGGTDAYVSIQELIGSNFNDWLQGDANNNLILAGAGDDIVAGSGGSDVLDGGAGTNVLDYSSFNQAVVIDLLNGTVDKTGGGRDQILNFTEAHGGAGDDTLIAKSGVTLHGGSGNDVLIGSAGSSTLDGGDGIDTVDYTNLPQSVYVDLKTGFSTGLTAAYVNGRLTFTAVDNTVLGRDQLLNIENVIGSFNAGINYLVGTDGDNHFIGGKNVNYMLGNDGNDRLDGSNGTLDYAMYTTATQGIVATLDAGGNGTVVHGAYTDTLIGMEGVWGSRYNDTLTATSGRTYLYGGAGNDTISGGTAYYQWGADAGVVIDLGGGGNAGVSAGVGIALNDGFGYRDTLLNVNNVTGTNGFNDTIWGNDNNNTITEINGNNYIYGSKGNDTLSLGSGTNTLDYSLMTAGVNADLNLGKTTKSGFGTDTFSGVTHITGSRFADTLIGDANSNTLIGNGGADILVGNKGNDTLIGGADGLTIASYHTSTAGIVANLSSNQVNDGFGTTDLLVQIGKIVGSGNDDTFQFSTQADLGRYQIDGGSAGNDSMVKTGVGGTFNLNGSVRISGIEKIEFADNVVDNINIDLNSLFPGSGSGQQLVIHTDASDIVTIASGGWTMTENTANQQTWINGTDSVTVSH